jgi:hypothetical protein
MGALVLIIRHYGQAVTTTDLLPALIVAGLGMGTVLAPLADILLARVKQEDAGSASGVFNTAVQLGASMGIAIIGVIFFGLLGTQSGAAATAVTPQLRSALTTAGMPRAATSPVIIAFRTCLHDRLVSADPTAAPASCRQSPSAGQLPAPVRHELAATGRRATGIDFATSAWRTLLFQVGVFLASFALMLALPGTRRRGAAVAARAAAAERPEQGQLAAEPACVQAEKEG